MYISQIRYIINLFAFERSLTYIGWSRMVGDREREGFSMCLFCCWLVVSEFKTYMAMLLYSVNESVGVVSRALSWDAWSSYLTHCLHRSHALGRQVVPSKSICSLVMEKCAFSWASRDSTRTQGYTWLPGTIGKEHVACVPTNPMVNWKLTCQCAFPRVVMP